MSKRERVPPARVPVTRGLPTARDHGLGQSRLVSSMVVNLNLAGQYLACYDDGRPLYLSSLDETGACIVTFAKTEDLFTFYRYLGVRVSKVTSIRDPRGFVAVQQELGASILCNACFDDDGLVYMKFEGEVSEDELPALGLGALKN